MKQTHLSFGQRPITQVEPDDDREKATGSEKKRKAQPSLSVSQKTARSFSSLQMWTQSPTNGAPSRPSVARIPCHHHKQPTNQAMLQCTVLNGDGSRCLQHFCSDCLESVYEQSMSYILLRGKSNEYRGGRDHVFKYDYLWACPVCAGQCKCSSCACVQPSKQVGMVDSTSTTTPTTDMTAEDLSLERIFGGKQESKNVDSQTVRRGISSMQAIDEIRDGMSLSDVSDEGQKEILAQTASIGPMSSDRAILVEVNGQVPGKKERTSDEEHIKGISQKTPIDEKAAITSPDALVALPDVKTRFVQTTIALAPRKLQAPIMQRMKTRLPVANIRQRIWLYETLVRFDVLKVPKQKVLQKLDRFDNWTEDHLYLILNSLACFLAGITNLHQTAQKNSPQGLIRALQNAAEGARDPTVWSEARLYCEAKGASIVDLERVEILPEQEAKQVALEREEVVGGTLLSRRAMTSRRAANTAAMAKVRGLVSPDDTDEDDSEETDSDEGDFVVGRRSLRISASKVGRGGPRRGVERAVEDKPEVQACAVPKRGRGRPRKTVTEQSDDRKQSEMLQLPKRGRGRPCKIVAEQSDREGQNESTVSVKRRPGRPRKIAAKQSDGEVQSEELVSPKMGRGRPKKIVQDSEEELSSSPESSSLLSTGDSSSSLESSSVLTSSDSSTSDGEISSGEESRPSTPHNSNSVVRKEHTPIELSDSDSSSDEASGPESAPERKEPHVMAMVGEVDVLPHFEMRVAILTGLVELALQMSEIAKEVEDGMQEVKRCEKEGRHSERELQKEHEEQRDLVNARRTDMQRIGKGDEWEQEMSKLIKEQAFARLQQHMETHLQCDANKARSGPLGHDTDGFEYWHLSEYNEARPADTTGHWAWSLLVLKPDEDFVGSDVAQQNAFYGIDSAKGIDELIAYVQDRCRVQEDNDRKAEGKKAVALREEIEALVLESVNIGDDSTVRMDIVHERVDAAKARRSDESKVVQGLQQIRRAQIASLVGKLKTVKEYYMWHESDGDRC